MFANSCFLSSSLSKLHHHHHHYQTMLHFFLNWVTKFSEWILKLGPTLATFSLTKPSSVMDSCRGTKLALPVLLQGSIHTQKRTLSGSRKTWAQGLLPSVTSFSFQLPTDFYNKLMLTLSVLIYSTLACLPLFETSSREFKWLQLSKKPQESGLPWKKWWRYKLKKSSAQFTGISVITPSRYWALKKMCAGSMKPILWVLGLQYLVNQSI